jgi:hypothetical protein
MKTIHPFIPNQHNHSNHLSRQATSNCPPRQQVTRRDCHALPLLYELWPGPGSREDNTFHPKGRALGQPVARQRQTDLYANREAAARCAG